uniref:threonine--tRNA ligase n=1 Tax=Ciona savignyi TaxID=51511 RepID=H2YMV0_CIOSA
KQENCSVPIKVTLPDGKVVEGNSWRTTPYEVAQGISQGLADGCIVAKVNDFWDLDRPLEADVKLQLLKFDDEEAKAVYWHSTAHILGEAMERTFGGCLCYGPPIEQGFYYDMHMDGRQVSDKHDFPGVENVMKSILKEKQPFERLEVSKENLLKMFEYNPFKVRILNEKVTTPTTTVYRCGPLIDLCRGPHVRHTGKIKSFQLYKNSATYWEGKADMESLQRIYGISFPDKKELKEWQNSLNGQNLNEFEAKQRDHRKIGKEQELFFFHEHSPGSCFFFPKGAFIYNTLINFIKSEYRKRGFEEVMSPNIYNSKLFITSGHWEHYADNLFAFDVEKEKFALKPMNCPGHCLMFAHRSRSWRELPIRFADFGVLHRNELSGALTGLTRVRRFQQDDAHIFCRPEQIKDEMRGALNFMKSVYDTFGFTLKLNLSTRPENFLGDIEMWNDAEKVSFRQFIYEEIKLRTYFFLTVFNTKYHANFYVFQQLEECLVEFAQPWKLNPGDGAFYGPKIDIQIMDALKRPHQCATIQLDFQLPIRFNLNYVTLPGFTSDFLSTQYKNHTCVLSDNCMDLTWFSQFLLYYFHIHSLSHVMSVYYEKKRPVIIHRAILGSMERMIAVLTENYGGKWPLWLSPRQVMILAVSSKFDDYAESVRLQMHEAGLQVDLEKDPGLTLNKKIRTAAEQYNFILVVGEKEEMNGTVNIRTRDNK